LITAAIAINKGGSSCTLNYPFEKNIIEKTILYIKDRAESLADYFVCGKRCKLKHPRKWLSYFIEFYNKENILI
jgi:hypothetical protein